jgi:hypothetical protein
MTEQACHQTPLEVAVAYHSRGWMPLPVPFRSKNPGFEGWQNFTTTTAELSLHFNGHRQNIGVLLGRVSGDLTDVDLDCAEAVALAAHFLPPTGSIFGRQTRPRSHWLYVSQIPSKATFTDPVSGKRLVEVLTNGQQAIFPGSTHKDTGELIRWDEDGKTEHVPEADLLHSVRRLAAATLLALHWPQVGSRQDAALALAGGLLRAEWSEDETARFIGAVCGVAGDEETRSRVEAAGYTLRKLKDGAQVTGWPTLAKLIDKRVVGRLCEWLEVPANPQAEARSRQWDTPEELPDDLLPVPAFDLGLLPAPLRACIADTAERMQCPVEFPAVASLVAAASLIGNRLRIRPKRADDWTVVPNLWGACVGKPGVLKTPALQEALKPLRARERVAREAYQAELEDFEFRQMRAEAERDLLKKEIRNSIKQGGDGSEYRERLSAAQAAQPTERRYIVNDPTIEKLGELLNLNPRGLLLFRDELAGWLRSLDREGREQDRAFYLETWTGHGSYTYDRIGRGTLRVENLTLSMLGSIQPGPLSQYLRAALTGGVGDDGLIQRLQLSVYPDSPKVWRNVDRAPDAGAAQAAHECFARLDTLAPETVGTPTEDLQAAFLRFEPEAQEFFDGWRARLENDLRAGAFEHPALEAHMAKYRSLMPSLALVFHLIELVGGVTAAEGVSLDAARRAASWCTLLQAHARRIYGLALNAEVRLAKTILERIRRGDLGAEFTARDIYRRQWAGLSKPADVAEPLRILEDYGWLRAFSVGAGEAGGRPTVSYFAHPSLTVKKGSEQ